MDATTEQQWRDTVKNQLRQCTEAQLIPIHRLYHCDKRHPSIDEIVDAIPVDELPFVISRTEPSLNA